MPKSAIHRDTVCGEALFILRSLKENGRLGRSNKLADVKASLEPSVSLEFDSYYLFLRKYLYIALDPREAQLRLTEPGERVVDGELQDKFSLEVDEFFAEQLLGDDAVPADDEEGDPSMPPPPPDILLDENEVLPHVEQPPALPRARASVALEVPLPPSVPVPPPVASMRNEAVPLPPAVPVPPAAPVAPPAPMPAPAPAPIPPLATSPAPKAAEVLDQRYQKLEAIGSGPLGTAYKGRFNALGLDICVKELKDIFGYFSFLQRGEVLKRLRKELCAQAQVRHPGIIQVLDQNAEAARPYYVLELLHGSLKDKLEEGGGKGVPVSLAMRCFLQLAYALRAAHAVGLTHHNLKPENVLFDLYGNAKLGDFGLSRVVEQDASKGLPQVFVGAGGMAYLAPELLQPQRAKDAGPASDVYGLGIILYEMLTGQIPGRRSPLPSEVNPEAPAGLDAIFDKMTHDRVDQRYPDIDTMLEDFYKSFTEAQFLARGDLILSSEPQ
ncbi:serine/threonine-protein kinase [Archangium lipolyticum]|uniref:serine/threonine-protein kinase n=1 Tax=Archangium lipolyticum TaxID=2970465 RepID=UPI00214A0161|nr:serine/threonine-protein kinase [Archangium lipolyticum]